MLLSTLVQRLIRKGAATMADQNPSQVPQGHDSEPRPSTATTPADGDAQRLDHLAFLQAPGFLGKVDEDQMPWRAEDCVEPG
jgi:hypothetical protein